MKELTEHIKAEARRLGFDLAGVTLPAPSAYAEFYDDWLARGYHAEMGYMARPDAVAKRIDPQRIMPEARAIVVAGLNYFRGHLPSTEGLQGRVARYAWGDDYHTVMVTRLQRLAERIEEAIGRAVAHRAYVDTGPLLERELAQRAGLGWIGKNTNLIHPGLGSYFFLGELLLDIELEPDAPFDGDRCGSCTACLEACPTGALVSPRTLDARRCISYLTIEHQGSIPVELRPLMDDWIFGCDVCQEVCPWNRRFAHRTNDPAFSAERPALDLLDLLSLGEEEFRARFRDTPLSRPGRAGLLRNAAVALGNIGDPADKPALERALSDPEPLVAEHAAWALSHINRSGSGGKLHFPEGG